MQDPPEPRLNLAKKHYTVIASKRLAHNRWSAIHSERPLNEHPPLSNEKSDDPKVVRELFKGSTIHGSAGFANDQHHGCQNPERQVTPKQVEVKMTGNTNEPAPLFRKSGNSFA